MTSPSSTDSTAFTGSSPSSPVSGCWDGVRPRRAAAGGHRGGGAFAAVSSGDNSNIISARVARETFGVERVVARIYDAKRAAVYERLGIPTVATVPWTTDRLLNVLTGKPRPPSGATRRATSASPSWRCTKAGWATASPIWRPPPAGGRRS